ncbi:nucleoside-diphosphate kinase [Thermodesulfobium sp.]
MERTLVLIKPDAVKRQLTSKILSRFEDKGLKIVGLKLMQLSRENAIKHYEEHQKKPFFESLVSFITSGPIVAIVLEGKDAVTVVRTMMGTTNPRDAAPGTIRGDFAMDLGRNVIHGSDSVYSAEREIKIFFEEDEVLDYERVIDKDIYENLE